MKKTWYVKFRSSIANNFNEPNYGVAFLRFLWYCVLLTGGEAYE